MQWQRIGFSSIQLWWGSRWDKFTVIQLTHIYFIFIPLSMLINEMRVYSSYYIMNTIQKAQNLHRPPTWVLMRNRIQVVILNKSLNWTEITLWWFLQWNDAKFELVDRNTFRYEFGYVQCIDPMAMHTASMSLKVKSSLWSAFLYQEQ